MTPRGTAAIVRTIEGLQIVMMNRRNFSGLVTAGAAASLISHRTMAATPAAPAKARNVVLVHGLFADGSCWSEVIRDCRPQGSTPPPSRIP
jgi:hypothetical protein